jgi:hypothetical protein
VYRLLEHLPPRVTRQQDPLQVASFLLFLATTERKKEMTSVMMSHDFVYPFTMQISTDNRNDFEVAP